MKKFRKIFLMMLVLITSCQKPTAKIESIESSSISPKQAKALAKEAYIYGYAMVMNYKTIFGMCVAKKSPVYSGFNNYMNNRQLYDPSFTTVVSANNDTYYSTTFADLSTEPQVVIVPPTDDTYFVIQLVDMFTDNYAYIGTRTTGKKGGTYLLIGPDNSTSINPDLFDRVITSKSRYNALATRIATDGTDKGNQKAFKIQDGLKIIGYNEFLGKKPIQNTYQPTFPAWNEDAVKPTPVFFNYLNDVMTWQHAMVGEDDLVRTFSKIGVGPNQKFNLEDYSPDIQAAIISGINEANDEIKTKANTFGTLKNGWTYSPPMGDYGTNYLFRSAVAYKFLYTNSQKEAIYPIAENDSDGKKLDGSNNQYQIHFPAGELPPVDAFWSITMYDSKTRLMVANDIKRYSISNRTKGLEFNKDGSLTLYFQSDSPGSDKEGNWLPAPKGDFYLITRMYIPRKEVLDGSYLLPAVTKRK